MSGLRKAGDVVDPDYPPFFIDRAEDAAPASPQAAQIRRPIGNDSGGCGSSASWLTASPGAATPTGSWQPAEQCARLRDVASIRLASGAAWAVAGVRLLSWLVRNMTITAIPTSAKVNRMRRPSSARLDGWGESMPIRTAPATSTHRARHLRSRTTAGTSAPRSSSSGSRPVTARTMSNVPCPACGLRLPAQTTGRPVEGRPRVVLAIRV